MALAAVLLPLLGSVAIYAIGSGGARRRLAAAPGGGGKCCLRRRWRHGAGGRHWCSSPRRRALPFP